MEANGGQQVGPAPVAKAERRWSIDNAAALTQQLHTCFETPAYQTPLASYDNSADAPLMGERQEGKHTWNEAVEESMR